MRKIPFSKLRLLMRFFDITQNGDEFVKVTWTRAKRVRDGFVLEFRGSGMIYTKQLMSEDK